MCAGLEGCAGGVGEIDCLIPLWSRAHLSFAGHMGPALPLDSRIFAEAALRTLRNQIPSLISSSALRKIRGTRETRGTFQVPRSVGHIPEGAILNE